VWRWFVLSAMRNGRSISKLTGINISLRFWGSFLICSSLAARECVGRNSSLTQSAHSVRQVLTAYKLWEVSVLFEPTSNQNKVENGRLNSIQTGHLI